MVFMEGSERAAQLASEHGVFAGTPFREQTVQCDYRYASVKHVSLAPPWRSRSATNSSA